MEWKWEHNISCIGYITGDIHSYDSRCPREGKEKGNCSSRKHDCEYFRGIKSTDENRPATDMRGCCAYLIKE